MSRFNETTAGTVGGRETTNKAGGVAFDKSPELELYSRVATASLQNKYYESTSEQFDRIRQLLDEVDPEFAWSLAAFARNEMHLRSIPLVLAVELTKRGHTSSQGVSSVIRRPDEITEILSYYKQANGHLKPLANSIKKGINGAFAQFDGYQIRKWNDDSKEITLRDAMFLTHPSPVNQEQEEVFEELANESLGAAYTWESELSQAGQEGRDKAEVWEELIDSGRLPYMATLMNLRNILEADVSREHIETVADNISDPENVSRSRVLPFRFLSAFRALQEVTHGSVHVLQMALEDAVQHSASNIPGFDADTRVLISFDVSGSMHHSLSPRGTTRYVDIAALLGMSLQQVSENVVTTVFGTDHQVVQLPKNNILNNTSGNFNPGVGMATNGWKAIQWALDNNHEFDKVMIFTDEQLWNTAGWRSSRSVNDVWKEYHARHPDTPLYLFNVAGSSTSPVDLKSGLNAASISGWNSRIFDILEHIEGGGQTLDIIEEYDIEG